MRSQQLGQCASAAGFMHRWKLLEVAAGVHSSVWALVYGLCNYLDDNGRILLLHAQYYTSTDLCMACVKPEQTLQDMQS